MLQVPLGKRHLPQSIYTSRSLDMRKVFPIAPLLGLLVALAAPAADEKADEKAAEATAILDKGIKALGGEEKLAKVKGATWKGKGKVYWTSEPLDFTGEWAIQAPDRFRAVLESKFNGLEFKQTRILNGDKGWLQLSGEDPTDLDEDAVTEEKRNLLGQLAMLLLPLKDTAFKLTALPETKIDGKAAVGLKVERDMRDFSLFFDKESGLLLKSESMVRDTRPGGDRRAVKQEVFFSDYKEVDGIQKAMKLAVKRGGKSFLEIEISDFKPSEKVSDRLFAKP
jgi:hypothetical protein